MISPAPVGLVTLLRRLAVACSRVTWVTLGVLACAAPPSPSVPDPEAAVPRLVEVRERLRRLDPVGARSVLDRSSQSVPTPWRWVVEAEVWAELGNDDRAGEAARAALEAADGLPAPERAIIEGRAFAVDHRWSEAAERFAAARAARPEDLEVALWLADARIRAGDLDAAGATLDALRHLPAPAAEDPRIDLHLAALHHDRGDAEASLAAANRAAAWGRAMDETLVLANAQIARALALDEAGAVSEVEILAAATEALDIFERRGDRRGVARARSVIAWEAIRRGELDKARGLYEEALADYRALGERHGTAGVLLDLGTLALDSGDLAAALDHFEQSLALYLRLGEPYFVANARINIGAIRFYEGDLDAAEASYRRALDSYQKMGSEEGVALARINLAEVYAARGETRRARDLHERLLTYHRELGDRFMIAHNQAMLGGLLADTGELFTARDAYQEAAAARAELGDRLTEAETRLDLAELVLAHGDPTTAIRLALSAREVLWREGALDQAGLADALLARALLASGRPTAARTAADQASQVAEHSRHERLLAAARQAQHLVRLAENDAAETHRGDRP